MVSNLQEDSGTTNIATATAAQHYGEIAPVLPIVPKRRSAFLENCKVHDDYLVQQGKRLSGLPLELTISLDKTLQNILQESWKLLLC